MDAADLDRLEGESFVYLTTTGRVTGTPHRIEIWFARRGRTLYLMSGGGDRSDWVRNLRRHPAVHIELGDLDTTGHARLVTDANEDALAREIVTEKYQPRYSGDLTKWRRSSLPVAIDLDV